MLCHSVMPNSLQLHGWYSTRFLCPVNFPGKNTGAGCHFPLHGLFPTQGLNPCLLPLLHWQVDSLPLATWEATVDKSLKNLLQYKKKKKKKTHSMFSIMDEFVNCIKNKISTSACITVRMTRKLIKHSVPEFPLQ